jgi:hypothetical protein
MYQSPIGSGGVRPRPVFPPAPLRGFAGNQLSEVRKTRF